ncbi:ABC transporter substrate-binding protein [Halomonas cupida]|uniref:ABC transporter substrate-binding protein n=1 Tax=Halomonas cupida TaxID=44933 RepID=UPI003A90263C
MPMALRRRILVCGALSLVLIVGSAYPTQPLYAQQGAGAPTIEESSVDASPSSADESAANEEQASSGDDTSATDDIEATPDTPVEEVDKQDSTIATTPRQRAIKQSSQTTSSNEDPASIEEAYQNHPRGPGVDTPTLPAAPSVVMTPPDPVLPPPLTQLELVLDWHPSPRHAALLIADALGLFAQHGLDVTMRPPADPDIPAKLVAASRVELALTDQVTLHQLVDEGKPLVRVATLVELPLTALVAREESGIDSALSLIDQRVGYSDQAGHDIILRAILDEEHLNLSHVDARDVHFSIISAMSEGRIDAIVAGARFSLPRQLADLGVATHVLPLEELGFPIHDGLVMVANVNHLASQRSAINRLVAAVQEATQWIVAHPDEAWQIMVKQQPTMDSAANAEAWPDIRRRLALRPGAVDVARYRRLEHYLWEHGLVDSLTPPEKLARDPG